MIREGRHTSRVEPSRTGARTARATAARCPARVFAAAAIGAAAMAWMQPADSPPRMDAMSAPSYASMADGLLQLYPAAGELAPAIVRTVHEEADRHRLDACLVMGVIARESSFRHTARNRRDLGLMQVNQDWHRELVERAGGADAMLDPKQNMRAGIEVLARYRKLSRSDTEALERYNGLGRRNGYAQRVHVESRRLQAAGACLRDEPLAMG
jgi:soluble lytic murein transglycosylase-like protein